MEDILKWANANLGLAQWILVLLTGSALYFAYKEFIQKRRPYIDVVINKAKNPNKQKGGWHFFGEIINRGTYPGIARVTHTLMKVGDERYPSKVDYDIVVFPGESKQLALIGSIYEQGIKKILGHEYRNNRVEIEIKVSSKEIDAKEFKYETSLVYEVDVSSEEPQLMLIQENFK